MAGKLRECPFCGGEPRVLHVKDGNHWYIECRSCRLNQPSSYAAVHTEEEATTLWNRRAPERRWIPVDEALPDLNVMVEAICQAHMEESRYRDMPIWNAYPTRVLAWRPVAQEDASER